MEIKRFFRVFSAVFVLLVVIGSIHSCANRDTVPRVDFTLDLTQQQYLQLDNTGGQVLINNIIVAKSINGYIALTGYCTYDNAPLSYDAGTDLLTCPSCQSKYHSTGSIYFGPATVPLVQYATQLNGNLLRVYTP